MSIYIYNVTGGVFVLRGLPTPGVVVASLREHVAILAVSTGLAPAQRDVATRRRWQSRGGIVPAGRDPFSAQCLEVCCEVLRYEISWLA